MFNEGISSSPQTQNTAFIVIASGNPHGKLRWWLLESTDEHARTATVPTFRSLKPMARRKRPKTTPTENNPQLCVRLNPGIACFLVR